MDNGVYYWRVKAVFEDGSTYSETRTFTIAVALDIPVLTQISSPTCESFPNFEWTGGSVSDPYTYQLQLSLSSNFDSLFFEETDIADASYQYTNADPELTNNTYYYRVRLLLNGCEGTWSDVLSYEVQKPAAPTGYK